MLVEKLSKSCKDLYFGKSTSFCCVSEIHNALTLEMSNFLLIAHALSGNDTASTFYKEGKRKVFDLIEKKCTSFQYLLDLYQADCPPNVVASIGEKFIISLYKGNYKTEFNT